MVEAWLVALLALGLAEAPLPELPRLPVEEYPAEFRARVADALERAERQPSAAGPTGALGMLLHAYDQLDSAAVCYQRARQLDPGVFEWAYLAGIVRGRLGQHPAAVEALRAALEVQPEFLPARLELAEAALATGDVAGAEALYRAILADHPLAPEPWYGLGQVAAARRDLAGAAERYLEATLLFEAYGAARYALALAYRDLGRAADARMHLDLYEKNSLGSPLLEDPVLGSVRRLKDDAVQHLSEGLRLAEAGDVEASIREHQKALKRDPKLVQAHANLISLYGRLEQWERAERHYRAALALNRGLTDVHYDYGVVLMLQGRNREAAEVLRKALDINPAHPQAHNNLGDLLLLEGRLQEAAGHFRSALVSDPSYRLARFNLARVLVARGRLHDAIDELHKIVAPEDEATPRYLFALGAAYVQAGEREKGVRYAEEARRKASALGQAELAASIGADLRRLGVEPRP